MGTRAILIFSFECHKIAPSCPLATMSSRPKRVPIDTYAFPPLQSDLLREAKRARAPKSKEAVFCAEYSNKDSKICM